MIEEYTVTNMRIQSVENNPSYTEQDDIVVLLREKDSDEEFSVTLSKYGWLTNYLYEERSDSGIDKSKVESDVLAVLYRDRILCFSDTDGKRAEFFTNRFDHQNGSEQSSSTP